MGKHILVIEDEASLQNILRIFLMTPGIKSRWQMMVWTVLPPFTRTALTLCCWIS